MGVLGVRTGGEADGLVAGGEVNVKPRDKSVNEIITLDGQLERRAEGKIGGGAGVEIEGENGGGVGNNCLELDSVDEGFGDGCLLERRVVESINIVPD